MLNLIKAGSNVRPLLRIECVNVIFEAVLITWFMYHQTEQDDEKVQIWNTEAVNVTSDSNLQGLKEPQ